MSNVQSVERAFGILRCLASGPAGVSEIAERLDLPKSTVSRLLSTLQSLDAVAQDDQGTDYRVSDLMIEIAAGANPGQNLISIARPHLTELVTAVGETAGLAVLDAGDAHYLDHVDADQLVQMRNWTGEWVPAHVVPSGLVMMAFLPDMEAEELLSQPPERFTSKSIVKPSDIRKRLATIREAGHAWVIEEYSEELNSVAAPVRDVTGSVVAAIHIHGPSYRFPPLGSSEELAALVIATADRISERLTHLSGTRI